MQRKCIFDIFHPVGTVTPDAFLLFCFGLSLAFRLLYPVHLFLLRLWFYPCPVICLLPYGVHLSCVSTSFICLLYVYPPFLFVTITNYLPCIHSEPCYYLSLLLLVFRFWCWLLGVEFWPLPLTLLITLGFAPISALLGLHTCLRPHTLLTTYCTDLI